MSSEARHQKFDIPYIPNPLTENVKVVNVWLKNGVDICSASLGCITLGRMVNRERDRQTEIAYELMS